MLAARNVISFNAGPSTRFGVDGTYEADYANVVLQRLLRLQRRCSSHAPSIQQEAVTPAGVIEKTVQPRKASE